jgi:DNA-binding NtrC family response regulator
MKTMEKMKNVLVCEDDPVQLKILTTLIDQAGYRSLAARTPMEAVVAARRCSVDAVLADVQLQGGNAFDLMGDLRRMGVDAPVFMASAYATEGMKDRARGAGARFFFEKPFNLSAVKQRVDEVLSAPEKQDGTLLLVESHAGTRQQMEKAAVLAGFTVRTAENGVTALEILESEASRVDLFLMDLHTPGAGGATLIERALEIDPALHIVMMSGDASRDEIRTGYDAGAGGLIRKPIPKDRFRAFLKASLKSARDRREKVQQQRKRDERLRAESPIRRSARWINSWIQAPAHSRRGGQRWTAASAAVALAIGIALAYGLQKSNEAEDRLEAMREQALQTLNPGSDARALREEAALKRLQVAEQLRLTREANDFTRRYYEGHLQEIRWQNQTKGSPEMPVSMPDRRLPERK